MKIYILLLIFISVEAETITKKCNSLIFLNCGRNGNKFAKEHDIPIPTNEKEISTRCEIFDEIKNCLYNYGQNCMTAMDRIIGDFTLSGTNHEMKDFCTDNQYRKEYLREMSCIKDNFGHVSSCYKDKMASLEYMYRDDSSGNKFPTFCCGLNRLKKCILDPFEEKCNKNATAMMEMQLLTFVFTDAIMAYCYTYFLENCPSLPTKADYKGQYENYYLIDYISPYAKE